LSPPDLALLARVQAQLRRGFASGSEVRTTDAFAVYLWLHGDVFYRTRALPLRRPQEGWAADIAAMLDVFAAAGRTPRLEVLEELWPDLPPALIAGGLVCELRARVLIRRGAAPPGAADGIVLLEPALGHAPLSAFIAAAEAAYGMAPREIPAAETELLARELEEGLTVVAAAFADGGPVAGASLIGIGAVAELAGVWAAPGWRGRGLAHAACARALGAFAARGGELAWLSAGDATAERLYRRLGFVPAGTQLNFVRP
jgi:ribosomal protein S18 acetylase RimI-like enzyme